MFEQGAVAAAHIANAAWLSAQRAAENLDDNFVHFLEIGFVGAAAAPNVHCAIDEQFHAILVESRDPRIAEQKRADVVEQRKVRNRDSVRRGDLRGIESASRQPDSILFANNPALRGEQIKNASQALAVRGNRIHLDWPALDLGQDSAAGERHHARADENSIQVPADPRERDSSLRIAAVFNSPVFLGSSDEFLQRREQGPLRFSKQKILQENGLGDKGRRLTIQQR